MSMTLKQFLPPESPTMVRLPEALLVACETVKMRYGDDTMQEAFIALSAGVADDTQQVIGGEMLAAIFAAIHIATVR